MTATVLHVINNLDAIGGAELALVRLLEQTDRTQFRHQIVTLLECDRLAPRLRAIDVDVRALGLRRGDLGGALRALKRIAAPPPALCVGWMYYGNLYASLLGMARRAPVIWNIRHALDDTMRSGRSATLSVALSKALAWQPRAIVYNSAASRRAHEARGFPSASASIAHVGVDLARYAASVAPDATRRADARNALAVASDAFVVARFGRYHPLKGYELLLRAFARVPQADAVLVLGGRDVDANNGELRRLIAELAIAPRIRLVGERENLPELFAGIDLCVSSSHSESYPNVLAEALAAGVPCVATDVGDTAAIVGKAGWLVPAANVEALANALVLARAAIVDDPNAWRARARAQAEATSDARSAVGAFEELCSRLVRVAI